MSEDSMRDVGNVSSRFSCPCGASLTSFTYDGSRAILDRVRDVCEAPVTLTCLNGHTRELWMTQEEARPYFEQTIVVAR